IEHQSADEIGRNLASMKRVVSLPTTHYSMRIDPEETTSVLVSGQVPVVQSRLLDLLPVASTTLGQNVVLAVWSGGSWLNEGSVKRGLFANICITPQKDSVPDDGATVICATRTEDGDPLIWSQTTQWVPSDTGVVLSTRGSPPISMQVMSEADMPFLKDGTRPDMLISEHSVALLYEMFVGKFATVLGGKGQSTAFDNHVYASLGSMGSLLTAMGYHSSGNSILYDGQTGKQLEAEVFVGLSHAMKQWNPPPTIRRRGNRHSLTRQATEDGALLEDVDVLNLLGHGLCAATQDALIDRGDGMNLAVCNVTGLPAISRPERNVFYSLAVDGPVQFIDQDRVDYVSSEAGRRPLSMIRVPYAYKLLSQELRTMGIQLRTITDDQVDQLQWRVNRERNPPSAFFKMKRKSQSIPKEKKWDGAIDYHNVMHLLDEKEKMGGGVKTKKPQTQQDDDDTIVLEDVIDLTTSPSPSPSPSFVLEDHVVHETRKHTTDIGVGDRVCLQGVTDGYVARPWQIVRIGDAFYTLRAVDTTNL
ncbi:hypothetical protein EBR57_08670, partial [bacterium]|nr:hypothetical protein [bacterium]